MYLPFVKKTICSSRNISFVTTLLAPLLSTLCLALPVTSNAAIQQDYNYVPAQSYNYTPAHCCVPQAATYIPPTQPIPRRVECPIPPPLPPLPPPPACYIEESCCPVEAPIASAKAVPCRVEATYGETLVHLDGSTSRSSSGNEFLRYSWTQVRGLPALSISNSSYANATISIPSYISSQPTCFTFKLVVTNNAGLSDSTDVN